MKIERPSTTKKTLNVAEIDSGDVGMFIKVSKNLRKRIKQMALDQERTVQDLVLEAIEKEFK